jgi:hypothetical protein
VPSTKLPDSSDAGYVYGRDGSGFILGNRHIVKLQGGTLVLNDRAQHLMASVTEFIVHELTHMRQAQLLAENPEWEQTRGVHRDLGWYTAVAEACPRYLGVECPQSSWPTGPRMRKGANTLTEVDMTHWPGSLRELTHTGDPRLPKIVDAA